MTAADRLERAKSPVLFLHALGGSASQWRAQIEHLEPSRLAVAVDLPGHGVSAPAEDGEYSPEAIAAEVGSVLDALGLPPVVLVGHSYGSLVAIALTARRPADVVGILLVEALAPATYRDAIAAHYEGALRRLPARRASGQGCSREPSSPGSRRARRRRRVGRIRGSESVSPGCDSRRILRHDSSPYHHMDVAGRRP